MCREERGACVLASVVGAGKRGGVAQSLSSLATGSEPEF